MIIVIDFDGTVVEQDRPYDDLESPLVLMGGVLPALRALREAGHTLVLSSARSNIALREDWNLNPLWREGVVPFDFKRWHRDKDLNQARYEQMLVFVEEHLPGAFHVIDDGRQGKFVGAGLFIDDKGYGFLPGDWSDIQNIYGELDAETEAAN